MAWLLDNAKGAPFKMIVFHAILAGRNGEANPLIGFYVFSNPSIFKSISFAFWLVGSNASDFE
jgi:hypothetical protein